MSFPNAIRDSIEALLCSAGVPRIGSVGWSSESEPDPELVGHAMWQLSGSNLDMDLLDRHSPITERPEDTNKYIATLGEDFCGLMDASRLSIGFSLMWYEPARDGSMESEDFFWSHHCDAHLKLSVASDRLRDFLIVACTGSSPTVFSKHCSRNRKFTTPFIDAGRLLAGRGIVDERLEAPLNALGPEGNRIYEFVKKRNEIVHELATEMAKFTKDAYSQLQERFDHESKAGFCPPDYEFDDVINRIADARCSWEQKLREAVDEIKEWHALLIRSSHHVFEVEYWSRLLGGRQEAT